jgi:hypothetical protein
MRRLPDDISFQQWAGHVFNHPVIEPQWWFHLDDEYGEQWNALANPGTTLAYLTRLFRTPAFLIARYTRRQIDQGLSYVVSNLCSDHMSLLTETALPWADRVACVEAMCTLYSELMAPVYGNDLGHLVQATDVTERATFACYMWWHVIPLQGGLDHPDRERINAAVLHVFEETLKLTAEACVESVLHGLGHWRLYVPDRTEPIVRRFLASRQDISAALREYAERAAVGAIL